MNFKKWTSIENSHNEKFLNKAIRIYPQLEKEEKFYIVEKIDGCLDADTIILTENGKKTIKEICEKEYKGKVFTFNIKTGKIEKEKISNFSIKEPKDVQWYELELENGSILKITGNHRVWLPDYKCYRKVEDLVVGDNLQKR
jgi:hypothetical protein